MHHFLRHAYLFARIKLAILPVLTLLMAQPAYAHAPIEGMDSFMNGVLHPLIIPAQVLLLISLGLLIGRQGDKVFTMILPAFLVALLLSAGLSLWVIPPTEWLLLITAIVMALWGISGRALASKLLLVAALLVAFLVGTDSLIEEFNGRERYFALLGSCLGSYVLLVYTSGIAERLRHFQEGIVLRILSSWIIASILLVLSFKLTGIGEEPITSIKSGPDSPPIVVN